MFEKSIWIEESTTRPAVNPKKNVPFLLFFSLTTEIVLFFFLYLSKPFLMYNSMNAEIFFIVSSLAV